MATLAAAAAGVALPAEAAPRPSGISVPRAFFGMHDSDVTSWPATGAVGAVRLWDSGVTWRALERAPGVFSWERLDGQVAAARAHRAEITLVLGQTPSFYATGAARTGYLGQNAPQMPQLTAWRRYVRAVATRYAGRVAALQVWNEANVVGFWSGSVSQMARLTYEARTQINAVNKAKRKHLKLVSPAWVARSNQTPFKSYWRSAKINGRRMGTLVDAVSLSLYPSAAGKPEDAMVLLARARKTLSAARVTKPVWNTEVNYGLAAGGVGTPPAAIGVDRQAAYVSRTFLLNAANRVQRVFWYAWDLSSVANTMLSTNGVPTRAAKSLSVSRSWLTSGRLKGCTRTSRGALRGTYTCTLSGRGGVSRVYWNPTRTVTVTTARSATRRTSLYGVTARIKGGARLRVDYRPVLVRSGS